MNEGRGGGIDEVVDDADELGSPFTGSTMSIGGGPNTIGKPSRWEGNNFLNSFCCFSHFLPAFDFRNSGFGLTRIDLIGCGGPAAGSIMCSGGGGGRNIESGGPPNGFAKSGISTWDDAIGSIGNIGYDVELKVPALDCWPRPNMAVCCM